MKEIVISNYPNKVTLTQLEKRLSSLGNEDRAFLADVIFHRLTHRYIKPLEKNIDCTSSFLLLASTCLLIETVQCFREGKNDTNAKHEGKKAFKNFFNDNATFFPGFTAISDDFYYNIRCGILHQAETKNGWRLKKVGPMLDAGEKVINGNLFFRAVRTAIEQYVKSLRSQDRNSQVWKNASAKLNYICQNCKESRA